MSWSSLILDFSFRMKRSSIAWLTSRCYGQYFGLSIQFTYLRRLGSGYIRRSFSISSSNNSRTFSWVRYCSPWIEGCLSSHFGLGTTWYETSQAVATVLLGVPNFDGPPFSKRGWPEDIYCSFFRGHGRRDWVPTSATFLYARFTFIKVDFHIMGILAQVIDLEGLSAVKRSC